MEIYTFLGNKGELQYGSLSSGGWMPLV